MCTRTASQYSMQGTPEMPGVCRRCIHVTFNRMDQMWALKTFFALLNCRCRWRIDTAFMVNGSFSLIVK